MRGQVAFVEQRNVAAQEWYPDNAIYKDKAGNELSAKLGVELRFVEKLLGVTRLGLEPRRVGLHDSIDF